MQFSISFALLLAAVSKASAAAAPTCNRDNLLRCFVATPAPASAYCSSYLGTSTVVATTVTPTTTNVVTNTATTVSTGFSTFQTQVVTTTTTTSTFLITSVSTTTTTATTTVSPLVKRLAEGINTLTHVPAALVNRAVAGPACLTRDGTATTSYPASRISSACSCIGVTQGTTTVTATAAPTVVSQTQTSTVTATTIVTVTVTSTSTTTQSATVTGLTTSTTTQTASSTVVSCGEATGMPQGLPPVKYRAFYQGSGKRLNDNNPGNDPNAPAQSTFFDGENSICSAVRQCAQFASSRPGEYFTFALYRLISGQYECRAYFNQFSNPSYFNIDDPTITNGFGYVAYANS